mmetsp:Transcript_80971/g.242558  ORF Transcript_80971/g.242558 Transcript_80971/m.242558 type:complete len:505 (+) Transcript_80971:37-1551(+)
MEITHWPPSYAKPVSAALPVGASGGPTPTCHPQSRHGSLLTLAPECASASVFGTGARNRRTSLTSRAKRSPLTADLLPPLAARRTLNDIIDTEDHLSCLRRREQHLRLDFESLTDAKLVHVGNRARVHLEAPCVVALVVLGAQRADKIGRVVPRVVRNVHRHRAQRARVGLHREHLLARDRLGRLLDGLGHQHLGRTPTRQHGRRFDRLRQHAERVVQRTVRLVDDVGVGPPDDNRRRLRVRAAGEADQLVLADHHLLDERALAKLDLVGRVEGRDDVAIENEREALSAVEIGVLDRPAASERAGTTFSSENQTRKLLIATGTACVCVYVFVREGGKRCLSVGAGGEPEGWPRSHDAVVRKLLLGQVVDELPVDEHVAAVRHDALHLVEHLLLLGGLNLRDLGDRVHLDLGAVDLDLVGVHGRVGDEHLALLHALGAADANLLVEEEAVGVEVRIAQGASVPLDDLDLVQVGRAAQLEHGVDGNLREELLVLRQDLRNDRTPQE